MEPNKQSQSQTNVSPKPKPKPPVHQPTPVMEKSAENNEDFETDEKETSGEDNGKADKKEEQLNPGRINNEDWKTKDSGIPENASDNPNS